MKMLTIAAGVGLRFELGGKTVSQSVATCRLVNLCCPQSILNSFLQDPFSDVVSSSCARERISASRRGGKDVLPTPFTICVRVFPRQRKGQIDSAKPISEVSQVQPFGIGKLCL